MKKSIGITSATIHGLKENVYYCAAKCFWAWDIKFKDYPMFTFDSMFLYMGETEHDAAKTKKDIISAFNRVNISEGCKVPVIYHNNEVLAIGCSRHDKWVDVKDGYKVKTFKQLNINFDELFIACC